MRVIKWRYAIFKACEKDTCDMPLSSPSGWLKKQLDSAVIKEANKELSKGVQREVKLHLIRKLPLQSMQQNIFSNSSSVISAFAEAITPVTIHMRAHACLTLVWQCSYILGLVWAVPQD